MKKLVVMASLVAVSTSMMAMDLQYFLGAGAERTNTNVKASGADGFNEKDDFKDTSLKLKVGVILDKAHRISLSHTKLSKDDTDITIITGNYDYLIPLNNEFRLYTGIHAGNTNVKVNSGDIKASGLVYGAQVGAIYDITKSIEFELGLAYSKYNVDKTISVTNGNDYVSEKLELEDSTSMFAGINYKF